MAKKKGRDALLKKQGEHLKALRARHGLTQQAMADLLPVPLRTYQRWEEGARLAHPVFLQSLEDRLAGQEGA